MVSSSIAVNSSNDQPIYVYTGTVDAISLAEIQNGQTIVVVNGNVEMIYSLEEYNEALDYRIDFYGLGPHQAIDPRQTYPNSVIPIQNIAYYTAHLITDPNDAPFGALIASYYT